MSDTKTFTIDFKGLCAFVGDREIPKERIEVVLVAAEDLVVGLCRHDPVLVFEKDHFEDIGPETDRMVSFTDANGKDIGLWHLRGRRLSVGGGSGSLKVDRDSYKRMLGLGSLTDKGATVDPDWLKSPGMGAHLTIDHGKVSACDWSEQWYLVPRGGEPGPKDKPIKFQRMVRWEIPASPLGPVRLATGINDWIDFLPEAHLVISNLCPLDKWVPPHAEDVLAYYEFSAYKAVPRKVLYRMSPLRPGVDACPPVTGVLP